MSEKAPIAFFAYKRPEHTRRALEALARNEGADQSELFIFCEGPKRPEDQEGVEQVRTLVRSQQWCGSVHIIEREKNLGCANSIIAGVTEICEKYGRVIVIEDDLIVAPFFLDYMNQALEVYEDNNQVMAVSGYMFPIKIPGNKETVCLRLTSAWGWATWQRAWQQFDSSMSGYQELKLNKALRYDFDFNDSYYYFSMLEAQLNGYIDAWDIRWYLSVFMRGGLVLYPTHSLVNNIGFDGSGTHYQDKKSKHHDLNSNLFNERITVRPEPVVEDVKTVEALIAYFKKQNRDRLAPLKKLVKFTSSLVSR